MSSPRSWRRGAAVPLLVLLALGASAGPAKKPKLVQSTSPELRLKGFAEHRAMTEASKYKGLKWQFLGPTNISGRATDIAVVTPRAAATRSTWARPRAASGGRRTRARPGASLRTGGLDGRRRHRPGAERPQHHLGRHGEANIFRSSQAGCGLYSPRTPAGAGRTWTGRLEHDRRIIVHPRDPDIVYVAASGHEWTMNAERGFSRRRTAAGPGRRSSL